MKKFAPTTWFICKNCAHGACSFVLWTFWLLLSVALVFQLKIALSRELTIPAWVVHRFENKHAAHGLVTHFGAATIDPRGRILVHEVSIGSTQYPEPLLTARSLECALNFWAVLSGDFAATEIQLRGADLHLPAILSPSGRDEPVLTDLDLSLKIQDRDLTIERFNTRYANLTVAAHGTLTIPRVEGTHRPDPDKLVEHILKTYFQAARQLATHAPKTAWFDAPHLDLTLNAHPDLAAVARARLTALGARLPEARLIKIPAGETLDLGPFALTASVPLLNQRLWTTRIQLSLARLDGHDGLHADDVQLSTIAGLQSGRRPIPRSLEFSLGQIAFRDLAASSAAGRITGSLPQLHADIGLRFLDEPWRLSGDVDLDERSATLDATSKISPALIALVSRRAGRDLGAILKPETPPAFDVTANFSPGWKLSQAQGRFTTGPVNVRNVAIAAASAEFSYANAALDVRHIVLKTVESEARGSYSMDTRTNDFRFLLAGALRPPDIAGWFGTWWPSFWSHFDFSASAPPRADIEISGHWGRPYQTVIFLHADATSPVISTVPFDHVRTTLFIRPHFYDGLELVATRGDGLARGTFTREIDLTKNALLYNSFDIATDLDLREAARIFGTTGTDIVEPFVFSRPPRVVATGRLIGPASPDGPHQQADIQIDSNGPFTFLGFPLSNLSTHAVLNDDDLQLDNLHVGFARGIVSGHARLSGKDDQRRLGFDATLENGSLGQAIQTLEEFGAYRKNQPPPPRSKFQERVAAGRLDLRLSGDGNYRDPYSFVGSGSGEISGAELAQINLLGGLSEVLRAVRLNFTSLRLNSAQANFKLDGRQLDFSEFKITGPTAAIDLTGLYRLDLYQMDFNARVSPFELSKNPLASAVDLVLTPFTNILELKLSGSIDEPRWRFAYGPSSLLRTLSGKKDNFQETPETPAPTLPPKLQPPPSLRRR